MSNFKALSLVLVAATALGGCGATDLAKREIDRTSAAAFAANNDSRQPIPASDVSVVKVKDNVYVGARVQAIDYGDPLPRQFETDTGVTIARARPMRLTEVASLLTQITRIPVVISTDDGGAPIPGTIANGVGAAGGAGGARAVNVGVPQQTASSVVANAPSDIQSAINQLSGTSGSTVAAGNSFTYFDSSSPLEMKVTYTGRLSGLLDLVGSHFNVGWKHTNGRIVFSRVITRTFDLPTLGATQDLEFNLHGGSSSGSASGGGAAGGSGSSTTSQLDQKAAIKASFDPWKSIDNSLKQIIGNAGRYDVSPATGTITVTASPAVIQRVGDYVETMRALLSKQVAMSVQVLNVTLSSEDKFDNNITTLFRGSKVGAVAGNQSSVPADPLNGVIGQLGGASPGLGWAILSGKFAGSSAVVDALSQNGRVSVVTTASLTTVNGAPVPLQVVNRRGYLAQITVQQAATTTTSGTTGVFEQLTPGEVTTGFNMQLLPRILKDGNLVLQYGINVSELVGAQNGFDVFSSGGNQIQLPNVNMRNFVQQSIVPNGSTLVLAGFEQVRATENKTGMLNPDFFQLGGGRDSKNNREVIVILITPTLLDVNAVTSRSRGAESPRLQEAVR
ncbi:type IVB pilus formation R64 PilN family outer membrane protein [Bradyrhizobium sp. USDA 4341]